MSANDTYLAVFLSNKASPRWQAWHAMSKDQRRAKDEEGLTALEAWDEKHRDSIVYTGGPLGNTKRTSPDGIADVVNELTVLRRRGRDAAARPRSRRLGRRFHNGSSDRKAGGPASACRPLRTGASDGTTGDGRSRAAV